MTDGPYQLAIAKELMRIAGSLENIDRRLEAIHNSLPTRDTDRLIEAAVSRALERLDDKSRR